MNFNPQPDLAYGAMQNWMQQWADLETRLSALLLAPQQVTDFPAHLRSLHDHADGLLALDTDSSLYWLFQLAATSTVGYSTSHALTCWALCRLVGQDMALPDDERASLAWAALTMNIAMTQLQDTLAEQAMPPSPAQREQIEHHAPVGAQRLRDYGVTDMRWLQIVAQHHDSGPSLDAATRILQAIDRYAAIISPRETRPGKCVTDSARHVVVKPGQGLDDVGHALLRSVGICPPGSFVRLEDDRIAVVLRRSGRPAEPWVATVLDPRGLPVLEPELIDTGTDGLGVAEALVSQTVRVRLNHSRLLQLSHMALARQ
jgi:hypothetical protein